MECERYLCVWRPPTQGQNSFNRVIICFSLFSTGTAFASNVPTFSWLEDQFSPEGVPLLSINFHDGKPNDVAILEPFTPIPRKFKGHDEKIDKCIFRGHLRDEPRVYVTLTGGCPFSENFDVSKIFCTFFVPFKNILQY